MEISPPPPTCRVEVELDFLFIIIIFFFFNTRKFCLIRFYEDLALIDLRYFF